VTGQLSVALLAQAICSAFLLGALLLLILTLLPASRGVARQLWPILGSEAAILASGVLPWLLPQAVLLMLVLAAAGRIGYESGSVHGLISGRNLNPASAIIVAAVAAVSWFAPTPAVIWVGAVLLATALAGIYFNPATSTVGNLARFTIFPLLPVAAFSHTAGEPGVAPMLVLAFFLVEMFDSFSLLGGKLYGWTPLVPRLSPRKTWEGLATGAGATLLSLLGLVAWLDLPLLPMLLAGITVIVAAIAGDLLGSLAKRRAGVKDYPPIMTVQGGLLDIADAWLVAGPCLVGLSALLGWV